MKNKYLFPLLLAGAACTGRPSNEDKPEKRHYVDVASIDSSISPGDNFFMHVNGTWYDTAKIADDQVGVGSYSFLNIPQKQLLENILEEISSSTEHPKGSIEQKVGDFYASGMDTAAINSRGFEPLKPLLDQIDAISSLSDVHQFLVSELKHSNQSLIGMRVSPDDQNSTINIVHLSQTGLGLPDRDYYFNSDSSTLGIQKAYQTYLATLFELTETSDPEKAAAQVYAIEKALAASHKTRIERRVVKEITTKWL